MKLDINHNQTIAISEQITGLQLKQQLEVEYALKYENYYLTSNGKIIQDDQVLHSGYIHVVPRIFGGKGGFGSMLRAIGAQIEKTTNREACRDLSGRRLRDINEEQRLKNWIGQQVEREKEAKERKKKKLERLCEQPKHEFKDAEYDKERSVLPEIVEDAVLQGLQASCSSKRKTTEENAVVKKKKPKLWIDDEFDDVSDDSEDDTKANDKGENPEDTNGKNYSKGDNESISEESLEKSEPIDEKAQKQQ
ncbi:hypothetical protein JTB14_030605 [Gonioctena quinquepunctata]|nr:hypothetical protein JTB14_030605 [Gonioctena quinquepunctata]